MLYSAPLRYSSPSHEPSSEPSHSITATRVSTWSFKPPYDLQIQIPTQQPNELIAKKNFVVFCGTRPEIIKVAPVVLAFKKAGFNTQVVFTGQHPDIAGPFREYFEIQFDTVLTNVFENSQSLSTLFGKLILDIERNVATSQDREDVYIVQGDTSTALAAGMVAFNRHIPLIHLEAGLRTYDHTSPFPEEVNRVSISKLASLHIAPSLLSKERLLKEGVQRHRIHMLGNTGIDSVRISQKKLKPVSKLQKVATMERMVLITLHRRENMDRMDSIYDAIGTAGSSGTTFVVPMHPNPVAHKAAEQACKKWDNFICMSPFDYGETQWILQNSLFVLTDSGGLQEEATFYGTPLLVVRQFTERPEAIHVGSSLLVVSTAMLSETIRNLLSPNSGLLQSMQHKSLPFGDGHTADYLVRLLYDSSTWSQMQQPIQTVLHDSSPASSKLLLAAAPLCSKSAPWESCTDDEDTIDVILTVWHRDSLSQQLSDLLMQKKKPSHIWVIRNEELSTGFEKTISEFRTRNPKVPLDVLASSTNTKYHGRFHAAYFLSKSKYVSIWDDDVTVSESWLEYCIDFSKSHNDALVGGNGRKIASVGAQNIFSSWNFANQLESGGRVDFVGHSWTLKREHLRYFLGSYSYTTWTGEDIQLSAALQQWGIESWLPLDADDHIQDIKHLRSDEHASHKKPQAPRQWLICKIVQDGFLPLSCSNCSPEILQGCVEHFAGEGSGT